MPIGQGWGEFFHRWYLMLKQARLNLLKVTSRPEGPYHDEPPSQSDGLAPFGIRTMLVEPGFFRTELLTPQSTSYATPSIEDYAERSRQTVNAWKGMDGQQGGDPAKLAGALVQFAALDEPPLRFAAGADAVETFEAKAKQLLAQADAYRDLSSSLAHDNA